jgi:hypothetical protein
MPTKQRTKSSELRERLGTYFLGLAIGCMMVFALLMLRRVMLPNGVWSGAPAPSGPASTSVPASNPAVTGP